MLIGYETITCCHAGCGISFAVPHTWERKRRDDHSRFFCPNGHGQAFTGESDAEKLRRERDRLAQRIAEKDDEIRHQRDRAENEEKRVIAYKGHLTRSKKRHAAGVCPCCNRTFSQLTEHMKTKHPKYQPGADA